MHIIEKHSNMYKTVHNDIFLSSLFVTVNNNGNDIVDQVFSASCLFRESELKTVY